MKTTIILIFATLSFNAFSNSTASDSVITAFTTSYQYEQYKQYPQAIEVLKSVYTKTDYEVNLRLGWLCYLNADYLQSVNYYQQAISNKPKSIEARLGLAYPIAALQNWSDLIINYDAILKIDPKNSTANYRLGYIYFERKEFGKAEQFVQSVLDLYPFDFNSIVLMAKIKTHQGKISEAKSLYKKALLYDPSNVDVLKALVKLG